MKFNMLTWAIILSVASLVPDYMIKLAVGHRHAAWLLAVSALLWGASAYAWYYVLKFERLSTTGIVFSVVSLIGLVLIGLCFFHERLNVREWLGFAMALASVLLLSTKL